MNATSKSTILSMTLVLAAAWAASPAAAGGEGEGAVTAGGSCTNWTPEVCALISCNQGDSVSVSVHGARNVQGGAQCGGADAWCASAGSSCHDSDVAQESDTGLWCDLTTGQLAVCTVTPGRHDT